MAAPNILGALMTRGMPPSQGDSDQDIEQAQQGPDDQNEDYPGPQHDPRALSADGNTIFIMKSEFPNGIKIGDKVCIYATVTKLGAKNGVVVDSIEDHDGNDEPSGESDSEADEEGSEEKDGPDY
jgi:hypothetical protein